MTAISRTAMISALGFTATAGFAETDVWSLLSDIGIDEQITEQSYHVVKTFPPRFQSAIEGIEITGYAMPISDGVTIRELLIVADMGLCPFCGSGEHGGSLLVQLKDPLTEFEEGTRIAVRGTLTPVTDPETWQAAVLSGADIIDL